MWTWNKRYIQNIREIPEQTGEGKENTKKYQYNNKNQSPEDGSTDNSKNIKQCTSNTSANKKVKHSVSIRMSAMLMEVKKYNQTLYFISQKM